MHKTEIKKLLLKHQEEIFSYETKSKRIEAIIGLLEKNNPDVPLDKALKGSIFDFVDKINNIEIQPLLQTLRTLQTMDSDVLVISDSGSEDIEEIVNFIQQFIAQDK